MIGKVKNLSKHHTHHCKLLLIRIIIPPSRDIFKIEPGKVRRGKTEKQRGKKKNTNRRQCATRVKIISAKIEEEENCSRESPRKVFIRNVS